ncbi:MAG: YbaB/EbfC family nucleoid-associated protein [Treponema sp.]|nr:YbaB/EbfC family nucleoid-associated protein [Treponema sp.]
MNPFDVMKNLGNVKEQLEKAQIELSNITATGSAGGNMVQVTLNGKFELMDIFLDPICVDNRDVPMLQDLIKAAHHAALANVQDAIKSRLGPMMAGLGAGMNFPGMS